MDAIKTITVPTTSGATSGRGFMGRGQKIVTRKFVASWVELRLMMTLDETPVMTAANKNKIGQMSVAMKDILKEATRRGFYGTAAIEISVSDGSIQWIKRRVERIVK